MEIVHIDETIWSKGWTMLEQMTDKEWSLADATSFLVMRRYGMTEAFTTDKHFNQAGFLRVP
jgi:uncharacterized protein